MKESITYSCDVETRFSERQTLRELLTELILEQVEAEEDSARFSQIPQQEGEENL